MHGATEIYKLEQSCGADQNKIKTKTKTQDPINNSQNQQKKTNTIKMTQK